MTRDKMANLQHGQTAETLSALFQACRTRFLDAANLLEMWGEPAGQLRGFGVMDPIDLSPLLPAWQCLCAWYLTERFDPQASLFDDHDDECRRKWREFLYKQFLPTMINENEVVRNVLRALGGLPSANADDAARAVLSFVREHCSPEGGSWRTG